MNKYIVPICNIPESDVYIMSVSANSYKECQDKIMNRFLEDNIIDDYSDYDKFVEKLDKKDILIGEIQDIEVYEP